MRGNSSPWLRRARWADGLFLPGRPDRRAASILIAPEHLAISFRDEVAHLPWPSTDAWADLKTIGGWGIGHYSSGRRPIGICLSVAGSHVEATAAVRRRTRTVLGRIAPFQRGATVPLYPLSRASTRVDADRYLLDLLCQTLKEDPAARDRLGDSACVDQLIADIHATPHGPVPYVMGAKRTTVETLQALRALGFEHLEGGRPMPGVRISSVEEIVPAVVKKLEANPHLAGPIDQAAVRRTIQRHYTDVPPWPLGALLT